MNDDIIGAAPTFSVVEAAAIINDTLAMATPIIKVVGEVANFKISKGLWVHFDIKEADQSLDCFTTIHRLGTVLQDGMKVVVVANPKVNKWSKLSLNIQSVQPVGEGSIKKAFEMLRKKLAAEGLFDESRKRPLPALVQSIGVVSSTEAAGYKDFIKIINGRMGGLDIYTISTLVQGVRAPEQITQAIREFNQLSHPPQVIVVLRGGGSRDDLVAFDDERVVRAIAASRIPVLTGIGHEIDVTLADMVADVRASTPSHAAEILVPSRQELIDQVNSMLQRMVDNLRTDFKRSNDRFNHAMDTIQHGVNRQLQLGQQRILTIDAALGALDPRSALARGYALVWDEQGRSARQIQPGQSLTIETADQLVNVEVKDVAGKKR